jgi:hypothetical protein
VAGLGRPIDFICFELVHLREGMMQKSKSCQLVRKLASPVIPTSIFGKSPSATMQKGFSVSMPASSLGVALISKSRRLSEGILRSALQRLAAAGVRRSKQ